MLFVCFGLYSTLEVSGMVLFNGYIAANYSVDLHDTEKEKDVPQNPICESELS